MLRKFCLACVKQDNSLKKKNAAGSLIREFQSGRTKAHRLQHGKEMDIQLVQETVCLMKEAIDDHLDD